jgi:hypothetical protein
VRLATWVTVTAPDGELKPEEQAAGEIVATQLGGGRLTPRDIHGAPAGTHDLDVEGVPRIGTIALEVTSDREEEMLLMYAYAAKRWDAPGLTSDWFVGFDGNAPVDVIALVSGLEDELRVLEQHSVREILHNTPSGQHDAVAEVQRRICARGITAVSALKAPSAGEPAQLVLGSHRRFSAHAGQVNAVVVHCAER